MKEMILGTQSIQHYCQLYPGAVKRCNFGIMFQMVKCRPRLRCMRSCPWPVITNAGRPNRENNADSRSIAVPEAETIATICVKLISKA